MVPDAHSVGAPFVADSYGITQEVGVVIPEGSHSDRMEVSPLEEGTGDMPTESRQRVINPLFWDPCVI